MAMTDHAALVARLEWACKHYTEWYDGKRPDDAGDVAYALVSEIRQVLATLKAAALATRAGARTPQQPTYGDGACGYCGHLSSRHACDHESSDMSCFDCDCEAFANGEPHMSGCLDGEP